MSSKDKLNALLKGMDLVIEEIKQCLIKSKVVRSHRHEISYILVKIQNHQKDKDSLSEMNLEKKIARLVDILNCTEKLINNISESDVDAYADIKLLDRFSEISSHAKKLLEVTH